MCSRLAGRGADTDNGWQQCKTLPSSYRQSQDDQHSVRYGDGLFLFSLFPFPSALTPVVCLFNRTFGTLAYPRCRGFVRTPQIIKRIFFIVLQMDAMLMVHPDTRLTC